MFFSSNQISFAKCRVRYTVLNCNNTRRFHILYVILNKYELRVSSYEVPILYLKFNI